VLHVSMCMTACLPDCMPTHARPPLVCMQPGGPAQHPCRAPLPHLHCSLRVMRARHARPLTASASPVLLLSSALHHSIELPCLPTLACLSCMTPATKAHAITRAPSAAVLAPPCLLWYACALRRAGWESPAAAATATATATTTAISGAPTTPASASAAAGASGGGGWGGDATTTAATAASGRRLAAAA